MWWDEVVAAIAAVPWFEVIRSLAPVVTAVVAFLALKNWKRQDKAKREAEFLDQLTEAVHSYISQLSTPITLAEFIRVAMDAHAPTWEGGDQSVKGAVSYIQKRGEQDAKRLIEALNSARPAASRVQALVAKGQVFRLPGYNYCQKATARLAWQFGRMEALASFVGSPDWNWENPEIVAHLKSLMEINSHAMRQDIAEDNLLILGFVSDAYKYLYG
jgi:hypothetical protein